MGIMKIRRVECDQFAGIQGKEFEFDNGLNLVIGDNESGKSTMVDLIYQILFKDVRLDGRSDSDFINKYFPKKLNGPQGDVIDGTIVFETPHGKYKLKKEWEKGEGICRLTFSDGTSIKGDSAIKEVLTKELKHRAGVYSEIVFASQKRNQIAVESIMRALSKKGDPLAETRADLASTLTQVSLETGGVSLEKIEKTLKENISNLIGRWDRDADAPEGGAKRASYKNAWKSGTAGGSVGLIAKAYYEMDRVRDMQAKTEEAEQAVEKEKANIQELQKKQKETDEKKATFQKFSGMLGQRSLLSKAIKEQETRIKEQKNALKEWPNINTYIANAKELQTKQQQAVIHELYVKAQTAQQEFFDKNSEFEKLREVNSADIRDLRNLLSKKQKEESKLAGINLVAKIKQLGTTPIEVKSASSGNVLDVVGGEIKITEAVDIAIPGVLEMQLKPQGVDVEVVKSSIQLIESQIRAIYEKYGVSDIDALQSLADVYSNTKQEVAILKLECDKILGDKTWEAVKAENDMVPTDIETEAEIKRKIIDLCGSKSIDAFIGGLEATLNNYEEKYGNIENLGIAIDNVEKEKKINQDRLDSMDEIPADFQGIDNPDQYDADLQAEIDGYASQIKNHDDNIRDIERKLGEKSTEEYSDELQEKKAVLEAKKAEYEHWRNIYNVFCRLKEQVAGNPVEDIAEKFGKYLTVITKGGLELNSMDEQMTVQLASGTHALTYDILSDGTKDTVSLAFRLAMLEHLYPEGDGLAIFDDPFTDMDPKRVDQSCKLIQKFAENNQVIFITCDEKYKELMAGNVLSIIK